MEGDMYEGKWPFNFEFLQKEAIGFSLHGDQVEVMFTSEQFYTAIINECLSARHRITLAALYIGMTSMEQKIVDVLEERLAECGSELKVTILLDGFRASRDNSAKAMLCPLIQKYPHCQVSLYETPDFSWLARFLPTKLNELIGIQHMKLYVFDDNILLTGANLSEKYFTNRQDRYILVKGCRPVADFCCGLVDKICSVSKQLTVENSMEKPSTFPTTEYQKQARELIWNYYQDVLKQSDKELKPGHDTWLFPLIQLPPVSILQDSSTSQMLLQSLHPDVTVHFCSPYFNFPEEYENLVFHKCRNTFKILIPHPTAIDFHGTGGFAGQIPFFYSTRATLFLQQVIDINQSDRFIINEFVKSQNSFHSKGLWLTAPGEDEPFMTIVGSSNFNCRSVSRDLECQFVMVTSNRGLRQRLAEEKRRMYTHGVPFTQQVACKPDRRPKLWHYVFLWLFKSFF